MNKHQTPELTGTVKLYEHHLFISTPKQDWPSRIEESDGYVSRFAGLLDQGSREAGFRVKLTAFHDPGQGRCPRILSFPEGNECRVEVERFEGWVEEFFRSRTVAPRFSPVPIRGHSVFICTHGTRDERCGSCGPPLLNEFRAVLSGHEEVSSTLIYPCSHVGGHVHAGNVLIFPAGDWYGLMRPQLVSKLVHHHLVRGGILWDHWRGRIGLTPEEQVALSEASGTGTGTLTK